jgi:hypothetical protein
MRRLTAIPSRFQPIRSLKPRRSAVNSRCIHPPGRAKKSESLSKQANRFWLKFLKAKTPRCAVLDNGMFCFRPKHLSYALHMSLQPIFESARPPIPNRGPFRMFHRAFSPTPGTTAPPAG